MNVSDKKLRVEMLERELHGLDCELSVYRGRHKADIATINRLEAERAEVAAEINRLIYPTLSTAD